MWDKYLSLFEVIPNKQPSELVLDTSSPFKVVSSLFRGISILIASNAIVFIIISLLWKLHEITIIWTFSLIIWLPLFSAIFCGFFGRFVGSYGAMIISTSFLLTTTVISYIAFYYVGLLGNFINIFISDWIHVNNLIINWELRFDSLSVIMLITVNTVSFLVHLYSCGYMEKDPHVPRFMGYLSLFTFFMNILVTSDNFVQLFFGWEGVGICSYLLISFWFTRVQAVKAAFKAVLMNKIGDIFFLLGMMVCYDVFKSLNFSTIFALSGYFKDHKIVFLSQNLNAIEIICICFLIAAMAKSAQIGLHTWLADAMEGPTPVSALIHAATMVTAGVFLIIRCSPIYEFSTLALQIMTIIGGLTAFSGATMALVQCDVKKIIAFSTMSQLGYMFFAAGLSGYHLSLYHLFNHAFFKALLFLSAGSLIHAMSDEQDIRKMGGLCKILPVTYVCFLIGTLSLIGFPFTSGFFSKEAILNQAFGKYTGVSLFAYTLGVLTAGLTTYYSMRLLWWVFLSEYNGYKATISKVKESNFFILIPMIVLAIFTIFSGFIFKDIFIGSGTNFFQNSIYINKFNYLDNNCIPLLIKLLPIILSFIAIAAALHSSMFDYRLTIAQSSKFYNIHQFLFNRYHIDTVYNLIGVRFLNTCFILYKIVDQTLIEICGPNLIRNLYGYLTKLWKMNLTTSNTSLYIHGFSLVTSIIFVTVFIDYYFNV